jgi:hypothetical protein
MEINCEQVVEKYLLNQNPLYAFSFPISILVAIIIFGFSKAYSWSDNSYINQILIPVLAFLLTMVLIDVLSRFMISNSEKIRLTELCKLWMHDPKVKNNPLLNKTIDMNLVANYNVENFTIQDNTFYKKSELIEEVKEIKEVKEVKITENIVENQVAEISNYSPLTLESHKVNAQCIEESNCCNLCSGSGSNPCNIVAPIPGPQWLPQSAESVQNRLVNNDYTRAKC